MTKTSDTALAELRRVIVEGDDLVKRGGVSEFEKRQWRKDYENALVQLIDARIALAKESIQ